MNISIKIFDDNDSLIAERSTSLWEVAEMNLGALRKEYEEAMEREMKLEDVDDILYEMKRDEEKVDEHEDN